MKSQAPRALRRALPFIALLAVAPTASAQHPPAQIDSARAPAVAPTPGPLLPSTAAPAGPVWGVGEWEESEGVLSLWRNADLMNKLQADNLVWVPVPDAAEEADWISWLNLHGIPLGQFRFLHIPTDSIYTRDYGPWFVWDANGDLGISLYDPDYGPLDDVFDQTFANLFGIPFYDPGLKHVGGNYLPNGYHTAFSSSLLYTQNSDSTKAQVDAAMEQYFGIQTYRIVEPTYVGHIDTFAKPCDPDTLIVARFPADDPYWHAVGERAADYYATLESPWGGPFEILRLTMVPKALGPFGMDYQPYLNCLINNRNVYVAVNGVPEDPASLAVFQAGFPGYQIVPVDAQGCSHPDALHCRTRNFVRRDALRVYPRPPGDTEQTAVGYTIPAEVIPPAGSALLVGQPVLYWTETGGAPFQSLVMALAAAPHTFAAILPARPQGTTISFYVEALDDGGHRGIYPPVAPAGLMSFEVRADLQAPDLSRLSAPRGRVAGLGAAPIRALAVDDMQAPEVRVERSLNGQPQPDLILSRESGTYWYAGDLGAALSPGDVLSYRVVARDGAAAQNTSSLPALGELYCPVSATAEVGVVSLGSRPSTAPFALQTLGELGVPVACYEDWPADWDAHDIWFVCLGVFPENHVLSSAEAQDIVAALAVGKNIYLEGGDTWCYDAAKDLLKPWFGVREVSRGPGLMDLVGAPGSPLDALAFTYAGECANSNAIAAAPPAQPLLFSNPGPNQRCRAVAADAGGYRSVAASAYLGALVDGDWPDTRKEALLRILDFLGLGGIELTADGVARPGEIVTLRLAGQPGEAYLLFASPADFHLELPGLGTLRLDPAHLTPLAAGTVPPAGAVELPLQVPPGGTHLGQQVYFQGLIGPQLLPGQARLSNRDTLTVRE